MAVSIGETIAELHGSLRDYIEATYHISHPALVQLRRALLDQPGVISQRPYLETTPRYQAGSRFAQMTGVDSAFKEILSRISTAPPLVYDPPYSHQAQAIQAILVDRQSAVIMTGTGSGKTESFLLPILGRLATEARATPASFRNLAGVRALILYPMNALVNDQLGRLRLLLGDTRVAAQFAQWARRPVRFARYTSRTLYPGVRDAKKDQQRLKPIGDYYVSYLEKAGQPPSPEQVQASNLVSALKKRGKWPAKPDLVSWYGAKGSRWYDDKAKAYKRCVTLAGDPELFTRHEVHQAPPDVLVTNYSMLEYMLMRPLERPVFDKTREWLHADPNTTLLLVIDEAHLYRGAAGAEVALLIRRLRQRLEIPPERLQVICTSASFKDPAYAGRFAAQLTGKEPSDFQILKGQLLLRQNAGPGSLQDADVLASLDLKEFYAANSDTQLATVKPFLDYRHVTADALGPALYLALERFPPMSELINLTMVEALAVDTLGRRLFPSVDPGVGAQAVTALLTLGSLAKQTPSEAGLLPCRIHSFHRGLPGLWICLDPECPALEKERRGGPTGKLFSQPRETCDCGARVFELYTCRNCGASYGRAYTDNVEAPDFLSAASGGAFRTEGGVVTELEPVDLLLEAPTSNDVEPVDLDLITGRINPANLSPRYRQVYLKKDRLLPASSNARGQAGKPGEFRPCGVCESQAGFGRTSVQDHQTKGDQPFQALITKQIQIQPPGPQPATKLAPLRGRKVLIFSDSRQTAARLAPNLQSYSARDVIRTLLVWGFNKLAQVPTIQPLLSMEDACLAVVVASKVLNVRLRPELLPGETFTLENDVAAQLDAGALNDPVRLLTLLITTRSSKVPESMLRPILECVSDAYYGVESLALASIVETAAHTAKLSSLPPIANVAETADQKVALARAWLRAWRREGFWLDRMPAEWWQKDVLPHGTGKFGSLKKFLAKPDLKVFEEQWLPTLLLLFTEQIGGKHRLRGSQISLAVSGNWAYCQSCRTTQRPFPGSAKCVNCGRPSAGPLNPDADPVFRARKGYYRQPTVDALRDTAKAPVSILAAEHTAQLSTAQADEVFSKTEEHELLFQDVDLGPDDNGRDRPAIDVLSCTTTMEVGIDIGALSGDALRNMPPARANYQQRAGRSGRRGNAVATVTAFGSVDSHDEHYFTHPDEMIRGDVSDPTLAMDNYEIIRRHVTAYLLQRYHQERLSGLPRADQATLFSVLGTVAEFKNDDSPLNRKDFETWLRGNVTALTAEVRSWIPQELNATDAATLFANLIDATLTALDDAIGHEQTQ